MVSKERLNMVAPCGIDCGICEVNTCKDNEALKQYLLSRGMPKEKIPCPGCRAVMGDCPALNSRCSTYTCVTEKGLQFCSECDEFPCSKFVPAADRADILPHNTKVFNLCTIKNKGLDYFTGISADIKKKYFKGKMAIGNGPQIVEE